MVQEGQQPLQMLPGTTAEEELQKCHLYATALLGDAPIEDYARVKAKLIHIKMRFERINKDECDQTLHALVTANLQEIEETLRERLNESASVGSQVNEADLMPADSPADSPQGDGQGDIDQEVTKNHKKNGSGPPAQSTPSHSGTPRRNPANWPKDGKTSIQQRC
jgi:hypothetical protein